MFKKLKGSAAEHLPSMSSVRVHSLAWQKKVCVMAMCVPVMDVCARTRVHARTCVCVCTCMCMCVCVYCVHAEARRKHQVPCFIAPSLIPMRTDLSLNLEVKKCPSDPPVSNPTLLGLQVCTPACPDFNIGLRSELRSSHLGNMHLYPF